MLPMHDIRGRYVAAGKTGGNARNDPMGRRVFFGWNMPWSRQGADGSEGPWRRGRRLAANDSAPVWPLMEASDPPPVPHPLHHSLTHSCTYSLSLPLSLSLCVCVCV